MVLNCLFRLLSHSFSCWSEKNSALYPETLVTASIEFFRGYKKHLWELAFAFDILVGNMVNQKGRLRARSSHDRAKDIYIDRYP
jgi:hypothetical protein